MANTKRSKATFNRELAKLKKAFKSAEVVLKSVAEDVTTSAKAFEKVLEKEVMPNVSAKLKVAERESTSYTKAAGKELARLTKAYDKELAKLRKAKEQAGKKASRSTKVKPTPTKSKPAKAKPKARKTAPKKTVKSRSKATAKKRA